MIEDARIRALLMEAGETLDTYGNHPKLAADAMFHLNRMVKQQAGLRRIVYLAKNLLIQNLYHLGYCTSVEQHKQVFTCWNCGGTGVDEWNADECPRCNDGVYREVLLYKFVFVIEGQRYIWHQPQDSVTFTVAVTDDDITEWELSREPATIHEDHFARREFYLALVAEYLRRQHLHVPGYHYLLPEAS